MGESQAGLSEGMAPASQGVGPLLQRDYWAAVKNPRLRPSELMAHVRRHFPSFAPEELASFAMDCGPRGLSLGDELDIHIAGGVACRVRVVHLDAQSVTLGTMEGHPEAGRITFGAYRDDAGGLVFHIRSRARSDSLLRLLGFVMAGEAMQTNTWTHFVSRVATFAGEGVLGAVHAEMQTVDDPDEEEAMDCPTFLARGD